MIDPEFQQKELLRSMPLQKVQIEYCPMDYNIEAQDLVGILQRIKPKAVLIEEKTFQTLNYMKFSKMKS